MINWLLFLKINTGIFTSVDIIFKHDDYIIMDKKFDSSNLAEIELIIIHLINSHVPIIDKVYVLLDQENCTKYKLEKFMPKLSSRIHQVIYTNV